MANKKINKHELNAILEIFGKISFIEIKSKSKDGMIEDILEMRIKWSNCQVFIYEKNAAIIKQLLKYKIDDVVVLKGFFFARWFPGQKSSLPVIEKIIEHKKVGVLTS